MSTSDQQSVHTQKLRIRPYFTIERGESVEEVMTLLKDGLQKHANQVEGKHARRHISIRPRHDLHYWSPYLSVHVEANEEDSGCVIHGLYGPAPSVWTFFIFIYCILILGLIITAIIGMANATIGESAVILYFTPILLGILISFYAVSYVGQRKGHDQIEILHRVVEDALGEKVILL